MTPTNPRSSKIRATSRAKDPTIPPRPRLGNGAAKPPRIAAANRKVVTPSNPEAPQYLGFKRKVAERGMRASLAAHRCKQKANHPARTPVKATNPTTAGMPLPPFPRRLTSMRKVTNEPRNVDPQTARQ